MQLFKRITRFVQFSMILISLGIITANDAFAQNNDDVRGLYNAVLLHEGTNFYQFAKITLRTTNVGGQLKVASNVKVLFGEIDSNEYLTYEYPEVPLNLVLRH